MCSAATFTIFVLGTLYSTCWWVTTMDNNPKVLTVSELAQYLHIGITTAYALVRSGQIRSIKVGRVYRILLAAVEEYLKIKSNI